MAYESGRSQRCSRQSIRTLRPGSGCSRRTGTMADERDLKLVVNDAPIDNCGAGRRDASAGRSGESHRPSRGPSDADATLRKLLTIFDDERVVNRVALAPLIRNVLFQKKAPAGAGALGFTVTWGWSAHVKRLLHVYQ